MSEQRRVITIHVEGGVVQTVYAQGFAPEELPDVELVDLDNAEAEGLDAYNRATAALAALQDAAVIF